MTAPIIKSLAVALVSLFLLSTNAQAQNNGGLVGILDVAKVFKQNEAFESKMKAIRAEADKLKADITAQQEKIKEEARALNNYGVGTPDRNRLEAELAQKQTTLRTQAHQAEVNLLNREAKIYHDTYEAMQGVVESIATKYGFYLVLRFDSEQIDPTNRTEVIKGVNRSVVFSREIDLTNMVSKTLNARTAQATGGSQLK